MNRLTEWTPRNLANWFEAPRREFLDRFFAPADGNETGHWMPRIDIKESPTDYVMTVETPGIDPKDIQITMSGDTIDIRGEKRCEEKRVEDHWHVSERSYGAFQRSFTFPTPVQDDAAKAETKDGVLVLTVKKSKSALPRKITVLSK